MTDPTLRGYTIFCDDIRSEVGGKTTFVGTYDGVLFIHGEFPFVLGKFGMAIRYQEQKGVFTNEEATLRIFLPGDEANKASIENLLPMQDARKNASPAPLDDDPSEIKYIAVGANLIFSPLVIPKAGTIKVWVQCGEETVKLGNLVVIKAGTEAPRSS